MKVTFRYYNPVLKLAFNSWNEVYLLAEQPVLLKTGIHRSCLVYRMPQTGKRISYKKIRQGLLKQDIVLEFELLPAKEKINWL